jgi:hypothetical protein
MSIVNPFSSVVFMPLYSKNDGTFEQLDLTSTSSKASYPIQGPTQVVEWGVIVSTVFVAFTVKPIVTLQRLPLLAGTPAVIQAMTLAASNTLLRHYTNNVDVIAAGGPGVVTSGPSIGGHTSAATADSDFIKGTVILADTSSMPSVVLTAGDLLQVAVTTAGTVGTGKVIAFARLEPVAETYANKLVYVSYNAIP